MLIAPTACRVTITITASIKQDLRALVRWIAQHDLPGAAAHVLDKLLETCTYAAATQCPDLPPCLSSRRTSVITMPRSAALHMS